MPWSRLDDGFYGHWKRIRGLVGLAADGLLARAMSRTGHYERDGFVEEAWVEDQLRPAGARWGRRILDAALGGGLLERLEAGEVEEIEALPRAGLRTSVVSVVIGPHRTPGYLVHDYVQYNPARVELEAKREREREKKAKRRGGSSRQESPGDSQEESSSSLPSPSQPFPFSEGSGGSDAMADPHPPPDQDQESEEERTARANRELAELRW